eukprot:1366073-Amphidinium_carterae.1
MDASISLARDLMNAIPWDLAFVAVLASTYPPLVPSAPYAHQWFWHFIDPSNFLHFACASDCHALPYSAGDSFACQTLPCSADDLETALGFPLRYTMPCMPTAARKHAHKLETTRRALLRRAVP